MYSYTFRGPNTNPHLLHSGPSLASCPEIQSIILFHSWNVVYWQLYFLHWKPFKFHACTCINIKDVKIGGDESLCMKLGVPKGIPLGYRHLWYQGLQHMSQTSIYITGKENRGCAMEVYSERSCSMIWIPMWHLHFMNQI